MGESSDRIGVKEGRTSYILQHPFFQSIDIDALKAGNQTITHSLTHAYSLMLTHSCLLTHAYSLTHSKAR